MTRLYANGWIVTCDDAGTEHSSGWLLVEDGLVGATGAGMPLMSDHEADAPAKLCA